MDINDNKLDEIAEVFRKQKEYFQGRNTYDVKVRIENLKKLKKIIKDNEEKFIEALNKDLRKAPFEAYTTEIGMVYEEINLHLKMIKKWSKREKRRTSIAYFPAKSYVYKEPYGVALIIGPFNYPFQLLISPLIGAISAGNCAVLKPSEHTPNTSKLLQKILNDNFPCGFVHVVNPKGGKEVVSYLLDLDFDYIFFTGSVTVGKIVMEKASKKLIPVTLELGGKSPCIVDVDANIEMAAKRLVWGKFLNAGQTCVAPDYLFVHKQIKDKFLSCIVKEIKNQFGEDIKSSSDLARIINIDSLNRLKNYLKCGDIYFGGTYDDKELFMEPTILTNIKKDSVVMNEELFGPILPVLEFEEISKVIEEINNKEKPLALYYFSESNTKIESILRSTTSGGVTINDTIIHVASPYLPFGGVGSSGIGSYHGEESFYTFTHKKSVLKRGTFIELPIRFAPYGDKIKIIKKILK